MPNLVLVPQSEVLTPIFQVSCPTISDYVKQHGRNCIVAIAKQEHLPEVSFIVKIVCRTVTNHVSISRFFDHRFIPECRSHGIEAKRGEEILRHLEHPLRRVVL